MQDNLLDKSEKLHIFSGASHPALTEDIAAYIGASVSEALVRRFNNGEIQVIIKDNVRG
jgi:phosphoribosylpyrophosphate synthetase